MGHQLLFRFGVLDSTIGLAVVGPVLCRPRRLLLVPLGTVPFASVGPSSPVTSLKGQSERCINRL